MRTAVLGATGLVGRTMLRLLEDCAWVTGDPVALASARSAGAALPFRGGHVICREVAADAFAGVEVALFSAGGEASRPLGAGGRGGRRLGGGQLLGLPHGRGRAPGGAGDQRAPGGRARPGGGIIANPNCSTIQIAMAVAPLAEAFGLEAVHVTTLQAVSGAGQRAVAELERQDAGERARPATIFPRPIAGNAIPAIGAPLDDGSFEEEAKVERELRKILDRARPGGHLHRHPGAGGHRPQRRGAGGLRAAGGPRRRPRPPWPPGPASRSVADPHDYATPREIAGRTVCHVGRCAGPIPTDPRAPAAVGGGGQPAQGRGLERRADRRPAGRGSPPHDPRTRLRAGRAAPAPPERDSTRACACMAAVLAVASAYVLPAAGAVRPGRRHRGAAGGGRAGPRAAAAGPGALVAGGGPGAGACTP